MESADALWDKNRAHLDAAVDKRDPLNPSKGKKRNPTIAVQPLLSHDPLRAIVQAVQGCAAGLGGPLWGHHPKPFRKSLLRVIIDPGLWTSA